MLHPERQTAHTLAELIELLKTAPRACCRYAGGELPANVVVNEIGAIFHGDTAETADAEAKLRDLMLTSEHDDFRWIAWNYLRDRKEFSAATATAVAAFEANPDNVELIALYADCD